MLKIGTRVVGTYHGVAFRGVVGDMQAHATKPLVTYYVTLDHEIELFMAKRTTVALEVDPATGVKSQTGCRIEAA